MRAIVSIAGEPACSASFNRRAAVSSNGSHHGAAQPRSFEGPPGGAVEVGDRRVGV